MNRIQIKNIVSLILNAATFALVAVSIGYFFTPQGWLTGVGNMGAGGNDCFIYFTNDSNIFAALASLLLIPFNCIGIKRGENAIPKWALLLKFVGTTAVTVTLMVVLLYLGPIMGYGKMFEGSCFFLHLICPLLAIISFCFFDGDSAVSKKEALLGVAPTLVYGTVYLINVIFTEVWIDFYNFNIGGFWYISLVVMLGVTYLFALILSVLHNRTQKHTHS